MKTTIKSKRIKFMLGVLLVLALLLILFFAYALYQKEIYSENYAKAIELYSDGKYEEAIELFEKLKDYKDADELKVKAESELIYLEANTWLNESEYMKAFNLFSQLGNYKDSEEKVKEAKYKYAVICFEEEKYELGKEVFLELGDYCDSKVYLAQIEIKNIELSKGAIYDKASSEFKDQNYDKALELFETIMDYDDAASLAEECRLQIIRRNLNNVLSAGVRTSVAITDDGNVVAIGDNSEKQCDVQEWTDIVSVDTYGCFTVGLTKEGKVKLAGEYDGKDVDVSEWINIIDVAVGERFVVAAKADGTILVDGHNADKQLEVLDWENVIAIDAGWNFTVALTEDKELLFAGAAGKQKEEFLMNKNAWSDVVNIAASGGGKSSRQRGSGHTVGLKADGTVVAVGDNSYGQCEVSSWRNIIKVVAGDWYTVGLQKDGRIVITGENVPGSKYIDYEIIEANDDFVDIAAGFGHTLCLHKNGTITAFGFDENSKCSGTSDWRNIMIHEIMKK